MLERSCTEVQRKTCYDICIRCVIERACDPHPLRRCCLTYSPDIFLGPVCVQDMVSQMHIGRASDSMRLLLCAANAQHQSQARRKSSTKVTEVRDSARHDNLTRVHTGHAVPQTNLTLPDSALQKLYFANVQHCLQHPSNSRHPQIPGQSPDRPRNVCSGANTICTPDMHATPVHQLALSGLFAQDRRATFNVRRQNAGISYSQAPPQQGPPLPNPASVPTP